MACKHRQSRRTISNISRDNFLPPCAPDLNPDEFVWSHVRRTGLSKRPLRVGESLKARVVADLAGIKRRPCAHSLVRRL